MALIDDILEGFDTLEQERRRGKSILRRSTIEKPSAAPPKNPAGRKREPAHASKPNRRGSSSRR
jgi:hypothetical protein